MEDIEQQKHACYKFPRQRRDRLRQRRKWRLQRGVVRIGDACAEMVGGAYLSGIHGDASGLAFPTGSRARAAAPEECWRSIRG